MKRYADGSAGWPNRLKGLNPPLSDKSPTTSFKNGHEQCRGKTKSGSRCKKGAQEGQLYCASHGEY